MKYPLILTSSLTVPPRYYVTRAWKYRSDDGKMAQMEVTGQKFDITEQIEAIVKSRNCTCSCHSEKERCEQCCD